MPHNPMHPAQRLQYAQRCSANSKRSGQPCQAPAVNGWTVCRMHGAGGGAPTGKGNGNWRHGGETKAMRATRRLVAALLADTGLSGMS